MAYLKCVERTNKLGICLVLLALMQMSLFSLFSSTIHEENVSLCPLLSAELEGKLNISINVSLEEAEAVLREKVSLGGSYEPQSCRSRWKIAIIIPFRNRDMHLGPFHHHMHKFLQKQQLIYTIFIVNQTDDRPFNRAKLFNVGFDEVRKIDQFDCFIFHDVDFLPDNDHNLYHCTTMPRHMTVSYKHPYRNEKDFQRYFGGVVMLTEEHLKQINGFSNKYWGWGGEDDDLKSRIDMKELPIWRYPKSIGTYQMLHHEDAEKNPERFNLLKRVKVAAATDGLNSLKYNLLGIKKQPLFTVFNVDLNYGD